MYSQLRSLLFTLDPETAHALVLKALHYLPRSYFKQPPANPVQVMGITFKHPIGLAAGLDKNADHLDALDKLGFSFIEVGTITPIAQSGNPKPRLFRLPQAQAIINRMGFNNKGVDALVANIQKSQYQGILGINIGKNKDTTLIKAADDYLYCLRKVYPCAQYITINISSPNTPDLRELQKQEYLGDLLAQIKQEQLKLADEHKRYVPLAIKVSPDETAETLKQIAELVLHNNIEAIIATNTTCKRDTVEQLPYGNEIGGLSGKPLLGLSTITLNLLKYYVGDAVTLIGVGGIEDLESAQKKLDVGAKLLQIYTGLVYKGPELVYDLVTGLCSSKKILQQK